MLKKMGFREWLFIFPTIVIIAVFSLWPVLQSLTYTFFDYRLNDQQKSGLYVSERFNWDQFNQTVQYVSLFLDDDLDHVTDPSDKKQVQAMIDQLDQIDKQDKNLKGVTKLTAEQKALTNKLYTESSALVDRLNQRYQLTHKKDLPPLVKDFKASIVQSNFIGLKGYQQALTDPRVGAALRHTLFFTLFSVAFEFVLGLGLALILNKAMFGQGIVRTTSLIPWAIPTAVAAMMWSYLYDGSSGIVAHFFQVIGLVHQSQDLLLTGTGAMFSAIFADVWKTTPYMALLLLAGLQNIPGSLYEASNIDGASKIQIFFNVTLPLLKPSILVALLFRTLDAFRVFDLIYVLTGGGPGGDTETLSIYAYKVMFSQTNFGYGSVVVMLMFLCVALIAVIFIKFLGAELMEKR